MHGAAEAAFGAQVVGGGFDVVGHRGDRDVLRPSAAGAVGAKVEAQALDSGSGQGGGDPGEEAALVPGHPSPVRQHRQPGRPPRRRCHGAYQRCAVEGTAFRLQFSHGAERSVQGSRHISPRESVRR
ncbi:hypothetical protein GCM10010315_33990 [Streptomyces luteosporeus]|uniref:Uncharacterized protein n=1 Tax=Streptomyces luteosporeus TaxID=173856 RepID=A0ABN3TTQ3_9ACTN